jgi:hypothetical protein
VVGDEFARLSRHLEEGLKQLVIMDIAARHTNPAPKVLPDRIEPILERSEAISLDISRIGAIVGEAEKALDKKTLQEAKRDLENYLKLAKFVDVLKGHLLFGVLRRIFTDTAARIRGKKASLSDEGFTQIMAEMVWRKAPSNDHRKLRRKIRTVTRRLAQSFDPMHRRSGF